MSSSLNAVSAIIWKDMLEWKFANISESRKAFITKMIGISLPYVNNFVATKIVIYNTTFQLKVTTALFKATYFSSFFGFTRKLNLDPPSLQLHSVRPLLAIFFLHKWK